MLLSFLIVVVDLAAVVVVVVVDFAIVARFAVILDIFPAVLAL